MRSRVAILALGTALAAGTVAQAEWNNLTGQKAPPIQVERWVHPPEGNAIEDLLGKVLLIEFWATW